MAVAVYATDLADLALGESGTYVELTNWADGTLSTGYESDYFIQGTACKSSTVKTTQNSIAIDVGATTVNAAGAVLIWGVVFAPNSLDTYANGGIRCAIGASSANFSMWYVGGSNQSPNPYGGWRNFAINPTVRSGAVTLAVNSTNRTYTRSSGDFTTDGFEPGMNIYITGCTNAGNNGRKVIESVTTTVITVTSATGLVTESGSGDEQVRFCDAIEGTPTATNQVMGIACRMPTTYPSKGAPFGLDAIRHGRCEMRVNVGDSGTPANFTDMAAKNDQNEASYYYRWGLFSYQSGSFLWKGLMTLGYGSTDVYFVDSNKVIFVDDTVAVRRAFNTISIERAGSTVSWTNCTFAALGTRSRGILTMTAAADVDIVNCLFKGMDTFTFMSSAVISGTTFLGCNEITAGGAILNTSKILTPTVAADGYALIWNESTDPDGNIDDMTFSKGTNAHHAIYFGASIPSEITIRGVTFTGFNASDSQNDSTLYFADSTGEITVNLVGCSGDISYKTAGCTIKEVIDPVTTQVTVLDSSTGDPVDEARVLVWVTDDVNYFYKASVSIVSTGTTATVTHATHGMETGDFVIIEGANEDAYNGVFAITYIDSGSYSYTMLSDPDSPATGTIEATFAVISDETGSDGIVADNRSWSNNQPIAGWVRKGTASPFYIQAGITGEIDSVAGLDISIQMIRDE
jgi:hypothetical protein